jgi:glycosyltransferase involved in cell wall biosynthesis
VTGIPPLISIIIPVYNGEKYLFEAIDSILAQTYYPVEIILIDDGSTDGSAEIAKRFSPAVKYCYQRNAGTGAARNRGLELAQGSFFAFLDADDVWLRDKLAIQMAVFYGNPETDVVFGYVKQFYSPELDEVTRSRLRCTDEAMPGFLPCTMLIKRKAFFQVGLFETDWRLGQDVSWIMRARERGLRAVMVPDVVYMRRLHKNNKGITHRQFSEDRVRIVKASLDRRRAANKGTKNSEEYVP